MKRILLAAAMALGLTGAAVAAPHPYEHPQVYQHHRDVPGHHHFGAGDHRMLHGKPGYWWHEHDPFFYHHFYRPHFDYGYHRGFYHHHFGGHRGGAANEHAIWHAEHAALERTHPDVWKKAHEEWHKVHHVPL